MGKQSHALNVRYFFISDQVNQGNLNVKYCPTDEMIGDFMRKHLLTMIEVYEILKNYYG